LTFWKIAAIVRLNFLWIFFVKTFFRTWEKFVKWQPFSGTGLNQLQEFLIIVFAVVVLRLVFSFI